MLTRRTALLGGAGALLAGTARATSYVGTVRASVMRPEAGFVPIVVPVDFVGITNQSFGQSNSTSDPATAHCTGLDARNQPIWNIDHGGSGQYLAGKIIMAPVTSGGGLNALQQAGYHATVSTGGAVTAIVQDTTAPYTSCPTISFNEAGGADIPHVGFRYGSDRSHDWRGGILGDATHYSIRNTKWDWMDRAGGGVYDWSALDQLVCWAKAAGHTVNFTFLGTPARYTAETSAAQNDVAGSNGPLTGVPPAADLTGATLGYLGCQQFVAAAMTRYATANPAGLVNPITGATFPGSTLFIDYFEVWNEPSLGVSGAARPGTANTYFTGSAQNLVDIHRVCYKVVKSINAAVKVVGGVLLGGEQFDYVTLPAADNYHDPCLLMSTTDSIEGVAGWRWMDEVSIHTYDAAPDGDQWLYLPVVISLDQKILRFRRMMSTLCGTPLPISVTEFGALNAQAPWYAQPLNDTQRGIVFKRQYALMAARSIRRAYLYGYAGSTAGYAASSTPIIHALAECAAMLPGRTITGLAHGPGGSMRLDFAAGPSWWTG